MMTPSGTVRPFSFQVIDVSGGAIITEFPERFVRCDDKGQPDIDHLYEVVETLAEARGFDTTLRMAVQNMEGYYYPHVLQMGAVCGWVRAWPSTGVRDGGPGGAVAPGGRGGTR